MPGKAFDAPTNGLSQFDAFRASGFQGEQSTARVAFDAKGSVLYEIPKQHEFTIAGTFEARHYSFNTLTGSTVLLESRGPFSVFWFLGGPTHLMRQKFIDSQSGSFSEVFGSNGGSYAKTDNHSIHPGWAYDTSIVTTGEFIGRIAGYTQNFTPTIVSSSYPASVRAFGFGTYFNPINSFGTGGDTLGSADIGFRVQRKTTPTGPGSSIHIAALYCVAAGVGTFTSVASPLQSILDFHFEFLLTDVTASASVVS